MSKLRNTDRRTVLKLTGAGIAGGTTLVGSATAQETIDWNLLGCEAVIPVVPVAKIPDEMLPDGFEAQAAQNFSPAFDGITKPLMGLEAFVCDEGDGKDVPYMSHFTPVIPPADLEDKDATWHFFKWEVLIDDPQLRRKLNAQGDRDPARPGNVKFKDDSNLKGTFGNDTEGFVNIRRSDERTPPNFTFREFTPTGNASEYIQWDVVGSAVTVLGLSDLKLPPKSRPANVLGTTSVDDAPVIAGDLTFDPATITLP